MPGGSERVVDCMYQRRWRGLGVVECVVGVPAKVFDVVTLTSRFAMGVASPLVLIPAVVDALFMLAFVAFLYQTREGKLAR